MLIFHFAFFLNNPVANLIFFAKFMQYTMSGPVHKYPDIFKSATFSFGYGFRPHTHPANSAANPDILESALHEYATCGRGNFRIRKEKVVDSNISGYVWTGPQKKQRVGT